MIFKKVFFLCNSPSCSWIHTRLFIWYNWDPVLKYILFTKACKCRDRFCPRLLNELIEHQKYCLVPISGNFEDRGMERRRQQTHVVILSYRRSHLGHLAAVSQRRFQFLMLVIFVWLRLPTIYFCDSHIGGHLARKKINSAFLQSGNRLAVSKLYKEA